MHVGTGAAKFLYQHRSTTFYAIYDGTAHESDLAATGNFEVHGIRSGASDCHIYLENQSWAKGSALAAGTHNGAADIGRYPSYGFDGDIGEVVIYNTILTDVEISKLIKYFRRKWNT